MARKPGENAKSRAELDENSRRARPAHKARVFEISLVFKRTSESREQQNITFSLHA